MAKHTEQELLDLIHKYNDLLSAKQKELLILENDPATDPKIINNLKTSIKDLYVIRDNVETLCLNLDLELLS